jgi:hypothetical protein
MRPGLATVLGEGHSSWVTTTQAGGKRLIYAFVVQTDVVESHLYVNYWDGTQWHWADQGAPPGNLGTSDPEVITFREEGTPRIYAFVHAGGRLSVNYWDGTHWQWANQGPPQEQILGGHGAITYQEAGAQRIYCFVVGLNGHLYVNYWDGAQWQWADQGAPPGTKAVYNPRPGVITYREGGTQRIYAFVGGLNDHLYVNYWDGAQWQWADQGAPPGIDMSMGLDRPGVITFREGGTQRIYAFVKEQNGDHLAVNYWDGVHWHWADQGEP